MDNKTDDRPFVEKRLEEILEHLKGDEGDPMLNFELFLLNKLKEKQHQKGSRKG